VLRAVRAAPKVAVARRPRPGGPVRPLAPAAWLALGVAVAVGAAIAVQLIPAGPDARTFRASVGRAHLRVADRHGDLVVDHLAPVPPNRTYQLWLQTRSGRLVPSTLFGVTSRGTADLGVPGDLRNVTALLVTVEPQGGSVQPTTRPVIQLPLSYVSHSQPT
jgi:anti-sigma-K factor RskA